MESVHDSRMTDNYDNYFRSILINMQSESESEELESETESEPCKYFKMESESESESECKGGIGIGAGTIRNRPSLVTTKADFSKILRGFTLRTGLGLDLGFNGVGSKFSHLLSPNLVEV